MERKEGVLRFEYKGKLRTIPYSTVAYGGESRLHLVDLNRMTHIFDLSDGRWTPIRPEEYPPDFLETLDWVIKQELGNK